VDYKGRRAVSKKAKYGYLRAVGTAGIMAASIVVAGCSGVSSRDEFAARVKDKSEQEVTKEVGKPAVVDNSRPDRVTWTYTSRTFNLENKNKLDQKTVVVFGPTSRDGKLKVLDVVYEQAP